MEFPYATQPGFWQSERSECMVDYGVASNGVYAIAKMIYSPTRFRKRKGRTRLYDGSPVLSSWHTMCASNGH